MALCYKNVLLHRNANKRYFTSFTEKIVLRKLKNVFSDKNDIIKVTDSSCGCGTFFKIQVCSKAFSDKKTIQRHQMVNRALKEVIPKIHGVSIVTDDPK